MFFGLRGLSSIQELCIMFLSDQLIRHIKISIYHNSAEYTVYHFYILIFILVIIINLSLIPNHFL